MYRGDNNNDNDNTPIQKQSRVWNRFRQVEERAKRAICDAPQIKMIGDDKVRIRGVAT